MFRYVSNTTIKNLKISGTVISQKSSGGIAATAGGNSMFLNLENKCAVTANYRGAGGIFGNAYVPSSGQIQNVYIYNSCNKGTIKGNNTAGGIIGAINGDNTGYTNGYIYNCYNVGKVLTNDSMCQGGIYGKFRSMVTPELEIKNSFILKELNLKVGRSFLDCLVNGNKISDDYLNATMSEKIYMESEKFINELNPDNVNIAGWAKWIKEDNEYPIF